MADTEPDDTSSAPDDISSAPTDKLACRTADVPEEQRLREQLEAFELSMEIDGGDALELAADDFMSAVHDGDDEESVREYSQDLAIRFIMSDLAWPQAGERLGFLAGEYGRPRLEELLRRAGVDLNRALAILAVRGRLIQLDLDPTRYDDIDVMAIHRNLGRLQHMKDNAERSCFIVNLGQPLETAS